MGPVCCAGKIATMAVRKSGKGPTGKGNTPKDDAFIAWMEEHGGLEVVDPEELGVPWPAKRQWQGEEDDGSPWVIPPPGKRCAGKAYVRDPDGDYVLDANGNRIMRPCYAWPMKGTTVCIKHGGGVERVRRSAQERLLGALDAVTARLIRTVLDPSTDDKARVMAINSVLDRVGVRSGVEVHDVRDPKYIEVIKSLFDSPKGNDSGSGA